MTRTLAVTSAAPSPPHMCSGFIAAPSVLGMFRLECRARGLDAGENARHWIDTGVLGFLVDSRMFAPEQVRHAHRVLYLLAAASSS